MRERERAFFFFFGEENNAYNRRDNDKFIVREWIRKEEDERKDKEWY